jgi:mannose-6-phosphate isomerase-like protein (cupin superfamily)
MSENDTVQVLAAADGRLIPSLGHVANRFMIDGIDAGGRVAVLQHHFEPKALAGPMHRHHDEDEYTFVLSGRIGARLGDREVFADPGDLIFKPRAQWHTFWNASDDPAVVLEIISPAGLEDLFKSFEHLTEPPTPQAVAEMAGKYHCDIDFEATFPLIQRHGLRF